MVNNCFINRVANEIAEIEDARIIILLIQDSHKNLIEYINSLSFETLKYICADLKLNDEVQIELVNVYIKNKAEFLPKTITEEKALERWNKYIDMKTACE